MKIYTKTGDTGTTGLVGGPRVSKAEARMHAIGTVDELNAQLGVCANLAVEPALKEPLEWIQNWLFDLGAELATPAGSRFNNETIDERNTGYLEESIDLLQEDLEPLKNFILPGGSPLSAQLHLARAISRRAEREILTHHAEEPVRGEVLAFVNRLSDWLFVAARTANRLENVEDVAWTKSDWNEE